MKPDSQIISLREIEEKRLRFTIPIYQRQYVWGVDQVKTLLEDLFAAFEGKNEFFLGGTLVLERSGENENGGSPVLELIDGQQRFTTLWLICLVWREQLDGFLSVKINDCLEPRLRFDIRDDVNRFLLDQFSGISDGIAATTNEDRPMVAALELICSSKHGYSRALDHVGFADFLREKVKLVLTRVPQETDLNKLFEIINNRGVQLQHHEILKARMLGRLEAGERENYARLWDACAEMNDYVERNLRALTAAPTSHLFASEETNSGSDPLAPACGVLQFLSVNSRNLDYAATQSLEQILSDTSDALTAPKERKDEQETDKVRSILNFSLFLQHVLRVWLFRNKKDDLPRIHDKELLHLFEEYFFRSDAPDLPNDVRSFIEILWDLRNLFDKHVIKSVNRGEQNLHLIRQLRRTDSEGTLRLVRESDEPAALREFSLLQSMLYHSQQITTHYWITPLLAFIYANPGPSQYYSDFLKHLDNQLFCTNDTAPLIEKTRAFMENPGTKQPLSCDILHHSLGTGFPHYWFYKLEFVLWLEYRENGDKRWKEFRFTAKNSVEHISPQTPRSDDPYGVRDAHIRDGFGNLALVSRGVNSEYGNLPFTEKKARFKHRNQMQLDSLKLSLVYEGHQAWSDDAATQHRDAMVEHLRKYLSCNSPLNSNPS